VSAAVPIFGRPGNAGATCNKSLGDHRVGIGNLGAVLSRSIGLLARVATEMLFKIGHGFFTDR
jgi:hypothetical protein